MHKEAEALFESVLYFVIKTVSISSTRKENSLYTKNSFRQIVRYVIKIIGMIDITIHQIAYSETFCEVDTRCNLWVG